MLLDKKPGGLTLVYGPAYVVMGFPIVCILFDIAILAPTWVFANGPGFCSLLIGIDVLTVVDTYWYTPIMPLPLPQGIFQAFQERLTRLLPRSTCVWRFSSIVSPRSHDFWLFHNLEAAFHACVLTIFLQGLAE
ncbi:unnamed protein product [Sphenostylis stenocarpa]|uniref:Uncharacterized protein n=1 Tax=Sphenostylis stenocarpa TaxID=92480 RepID=A0AA86S2A1_9FABA|nr:unnamed protein product [Sphenostylis stenocarpa]